MIERRIYLTCFSSDAEIPHAFPLCAHEQIFYRTYDNHFKQLYS